MPRCWRHDKQVTFKRLWCDHWMDVTSGQIAAQCAIGFVLLLPTTNRLSEVKSLRTEAPEWRFIPGKLNPVDAATCSQLEDQTLPPIWLTGTAFLQKNIDKDWPMDSSREVVTEKLRTAKVYHITTTYSEDKLGSSTNHSSIHSIPRSTRCRKPSTSQAMPKRSVPTRSGSTNEETAT